MFVEEVVGMRCRLQFDCLLCVTHRAGERWIGARVADQAVPHHRESLSWLIGFDTGMACLTFGAGLYRARTQMGTALSRRFEHRRDIA